MKEKAVIIPGSASEPPPIGSGTLAWLLLLIILWATNSVIIKITVRDIPPLWATGLRFVPAFPCVLLFIRWNGSGFSLKKYEVFPVISLGLLMGLQLFTFNLGARYTTGGRITLFIYSYPLIVSLLAPFFIRSERFEKRKLFGCLIAFTGLLFAFKGSLQVQGASTIKGDIIEFLSSLLIAFQIVFTKRLAVSINKWKLVFWSYGVMIVFSICAALIFENFDIRTVQIDAWASLAFQALVISVFAFMSWQFLLVRHDSTVISAYFFATPLFGMILGVLLLNESFEPELITACILVGLGIYIVNSQTKHLPNCFKKS